MLGLMTDAAGGPLFFFLFCNLAIGKRNDVRPGRAADGGGKPCERMR